MGRPGREGLLRRRLLDPSQIWDLLSRLAIANREARLQHNLDLGVSFRDLSWNVPNTGPPEQPLTGSIAPKEGKGRDEESRDLRMAVSFSCARETRCTLGTAQGCPVRPTVRLLCPLETRVSWWLCVEARSARAVTHGTLYKLASVASPMGTTGKSKLMTSWVQSSTWLDSLCI